MTSVDKQQHLNQIMTKIKLANGFRLAFLFIGVLLLLFLYFGPKFFEGAEWFLTAKFWVFRIAEWDVILLVIVTFVKTYFSMKYNRIVKKEI